MWPFSLDLSHVQIEGVDPDDKSATLEKLESASRCDNNSPFIILCLLKVYYLGREIATRILEIHL